jgi:hypothetical protein
MIEKVRNVSCPHYQRCLDQAAKKNAPGWDCSKCKHRNDRTDTEEIDLERYYLLLWGVFKPELYRKYRALEAARAQAEKRSKPGRPGDGVQL